jgi:hypothetical protein
MLKIKSSPEGEYLPTLPRKAGAIRMKLIASFTSTTLDVVLPQKRNVGGVLPDLY